VRAQRPAKQRGWIRRLLPFLRPHRRNATIAFSAALLGGAISAATPAVERQIVDNVILHHRSPLAPWLTILIVASAVSFGAAYFRRYRGGRVALDVQYDLRNTIYDQLQRLDFASHDDMHTGQLVSRANSDVGLLQGLLAFLPIMTGNVLLLIGSLVIMFIYSPLLALVSLVVVPALFGVAYQMREKIFPATWHAQQKAGDVAGVVDEAVTGVRVVKGFGQEGRELARLTFEAEHLYGSRMRAVRLQAIYAPVLQAIPSLGQVVVLALGGWLALRHRITIGTFLAFSTYLVLLLAPARMLAGLLTVGQQARAGAERIFDLLDSVPVVLDAPDADPLPPVRGEISFDHVSFGYLRSEPVLTDFDLRVAPGETVALVGASGSGKSTVALLLPRFYDVQQGSVRIDGADVRDVTLQSLRGQIGVVFEESFLFSDSVRANIAYGRPDATDAEVEAAARAAEAHEFILALPNGYDTTVGERGLSLSGGQRQRIALARALLTDPRILILDDATSAVDAQVEEGIHATLRRVMRNRTTLLIAHRRSTLHLADRIVVVDHGRIVDEGSHEELLARCRLYRLLLAGPGDDVEGTDTELADDSGERGAAGVTAGAWTGRAAPGNGNGRRSGRPDLAGSTLGGGLGPQSGGGWMGALAPTPELLAKVDRLAPIRDVPDIDAVREARHDPRFSLRRFLRPYRRPLALGLLLVVFDALATLAGPYLIRQGIDHGVLAGSRGALFAASLVFLAVTVADLADMIAETFVTGKTAEKLLFALRIRIWSHLQRLSLDYYDKEMAGRIMTRMTTDVDAFSNLLQTGLINAVVNVFTFVGVAAALCFMNLTLALTTLSVLVPLIVATIIFRRLSARAYDRARERIAAVNASLQESLSGVREAQAFVQEDRSQREFRRLGSGYLDARLTAQRLVSVYFPFVQFLSDLAAALVLGVGYRLILHGSLSTGELVAFLLYLNLLFSPVQQLSQVFDSYQQARASSVQINALMAMDTMTPPPAHPVDPGRLEGNVTFDGVRFAYPGTTTEALRGVDLSIRSGETVALVGETGAGKSTIIKLVTRFYDPTGGAVLIDGLDLRTLDLGAFRRQLGYVPQEAFLFSGTIRDNIAYGRPDATDAEVEWAARAVGAHDFVAGLAGGYLHEVTERGRSLSAGQRQLIALARARLVNPAILLLDEATSNLDLGTEAKVSRAMTAAAAGRTTILIAHRLQTARRADRIIVLDAGRVVEDGSHDELLAAGGRYAAMWRSFDTGDSRRPRGVPVASVVDVSAGEAAASA
jgi:ATP-binding cassette subfamily B protein